MVKACTFAFVIFCCGYVIGPAAAGGGALTDRLAFTARDVPGYDLRYFRDLRESGGSAGFEQGFGYDIPSSQGSGGYTIWIKVARCRNEAAAADTLKHLVERSVEVKWGAKLLTGANPKVDQLFANTTQLKSHGNYEVAGRARQLAFLISIASRGDRVFKPLPRQEASKVDTMARQIVARYLKEKSRK